MDRVPNTTTVATAMETLCAGARTTGSAPMTAAAPQMAEPVPTTPEQFDAFMAAERSKYQAVVKASGAKVD